MIEYNAPSLNEGTDGALASCSDTFPFRSDENIDDLSAYNGSGGSGTSIFKGDAADHDAPDRKDGNNQHEGAGASSEGNNGQNRNRDASRQNSETPHRCGSDQNQGDVVELGNDATPKESDGVNFSDVLFNGLGLPGDLLSTAKGLSFLTPAAIQAATIPILLRGRDVIGVAQTGMGKTAVLTLPFPTRTDLEKCEVQAPVLAPARELAMRGARAIESFVVKSHGVDVTIMYGGSSYFPQLEALEGEVQVMVGIPGRIMDLIGRSTLRLDTVRYFVLNEVSEVFRMGFAENVEKITSEVPEDRVSALFSAIMPPPIRRVAERYLNNAEEMTISRPVTTVPAVKQMYAVVLERHRIGVLAQVLTVAETQAAFIFVRTRSTAEGLTTELGIRGTAMATLSGDVVQKEHGKLIAHLCDRTLDVLVATDIAAHKLDIDRIGLTIDFDVPRGTDTYVYRIDHTG